MMQNYAGVDFSITTLQRGMLSNKSNFSHDKKKSTCHAMAARTTPTLTPTFRSSSLVGQTAAEAEAVADRRRRAVMAMDPNPEYAVIGGGEEKTLHSLLRWVRSGTGLSPSHGQILLMALDVVSSVPTTDNAHADTADSAGRRGSFAYNSLERGEHRIGDNDEEEDDDEVGRRKGDDGNKAFDRGGSSGGNVLSPTYLDPNAEQQLRNPAEESNIVDDPFDPRPILINSGVMRRSSLSTWSEDDEDDSLGSDLFAMNVCDDDTMNKDDEELDDILRTWMMEESESGGNQAQAYSSSVDIDDHHGQENSESKNEEKGGVRLSLAGFNNDAPPAQRSQSCRRLSSDSTILGGSKRGRDDSIEDRFAPAKRSHSCRWASFDHIKPEEHMTPLMTSELGYSFRGSKLSDVFPSATQDENSRNVQRFASNHDVGGAHEPKSCEDAFGNKVVSPKNRNVRTAKEADNQTSKDSKKDMVQYALSILMNPNKHMTDASVQRAVEEAKMKRRGSAFTSTLDVVDGDALSPAANRPRMESIGDCHKTPPLPNNNDESVKEKVKESLQQGGSKHVATKGSRKDRNRIKDVFPQKLMKILSESRYEQIISWSPDGDSFAVLNKCDFASHVLPCFFNKGVKFESFTRKLNRWGFERVSLKDRNACVYRHEDFKRGDPDRCTRMRTKEEMALFESEVEFGATAIARQQPLDVKSSVVGDQSTTQHPTNRSVESRTAYPTETLSLETMERLRGALDLPQLSSSTNLSTVDVLPPRAGDYALRSGAWKTNNLRRVGGDRSKDGTSYPDATQDNSLYPSFRPKSLEHLSNVRTNHDRSFSSPETLDAKMVEANGLNMRNKVHPLTVSSNPSLWKMTEIPIVARLVNDKRGGSLGMV